MTDTTSMPPAMTSSDAKAHAKAAKAYAKAKRPFYKKKRYWSLAAIAVIGVAAASSASSNKSTTGGTAGNSGNTAHPAQDDVRLSSCTYDASTTFATAKLTIINHSSKRSNYLITVAFENSKGVQLGSNGAAGGDNVEPGQTALTDAVDTLSAVPDKVVCKITSVDRLAA